MWQLDKLCLWIDERRNVLEPLINGAFWCFAWRRHTWHHIRSWVGEYLRNQNSFSQDFWNGCLEECLWAAAEVLFWLLSLQTDWGERGSIPENTEENNIFRVEQLIQFGLLHSFSEFSFYSIFLKTFGEIYIWCRPLLQRCQTQAALSRAPPQCPAAVGDETVSPAALQPSSLAWHSWDRRRRKKRSKRRKGSCVFSCPASKIAVQSLAGSVVLNKPWTNWTPPE